MKVRPAFVVGVMVAVLLGARQVQAQESEVESLAAWETIAGVLQHPRCLNCHQMDAPLQGDAPRAHIPHVVRGDDNHGVGAMRCGNCHNQMGNNETAGVPGAPHWQLSPKTMVWAGLTSAELCQSLLDPERNGQRSHDDLVTHMGEDALVLWGWNPGGGREPVPVEHDRFIEILKTWLDNGAECPGDDSPSRAGS